MIEILVIISGLIIVYYLVLLYEYIINEIKISKRYKERTQLCGENLNKPHIHRLRTYHEFKSQLENAYPSENLDLDLDTLYNMSKDNLPKENEIKKEEKNNLEEKTSFTIDDRLKRIEESEGD